MRCTVSVEGVKSRTRCAVYPISPEGFEVEILGLNLTSVQVKFLMCLLGNISEMVGPDQQEAVYRRNGGFLGK